VIEKGAHGLFYDVRDLLRVIRSTYNPVVHSRDGHPAAGDGGQAARARRSRRGKALEWVEETINLIVNTRYNERRATVFTTNYEDLPDDTELDSLQSPRRLPPALPAARNVRVPRIRRRRLPDATANGGPDDLATLWKKNRGRRAPAGPRPRPGRAEIRPPRSSSGRAARRAPKIGSSVVNDD
jgi:DNA replication protein DnaC